MMSPDVSSMSWDIEHDTFMSATVGLISGAHLHVRKQEGAVLVVKPFRWRRLS